MALLDARVERSIIGDRVVRDVSRVHLVLPLLAIMRTLTDVCTYRSGVLVVYWRGVQEVYTGWVHAGALLTSPTNVSFLLFLISWRFAVSWRLSAEHY